MIVPLKQSQVHGFGKVLVPASVWQQTKLISLVQTQLVPKSKNSDEGSGTSEKSGMSGSAVAATAIGVWLGIMESSWAVLESVATVGAGAGPEAEGMGRQSAPVRVVVQK